MNEGWNKPINERIAQVEQWIEDHESRHTREGQEAHETLLLAVRNELALSAASANPVSAIVKWVAGLVALVLVAVLGWLLRSR